MDYILQKEIIQDKNEEKETKFLRIDVFKLTVSGILLSLGTIGLGSSILGIPVFTNISTIFLYFTLIVQAISGNLRFPKNLAIIFAYIIIQTFILNFSTTPFLTSLKHLIGLVCFSISTFSFVSVYRDRIENIIQIYYKFSFFIASIGIFQSILFVVFKVSFIPQILISGNTISGGKNSFMPEILGILPRAIGLSTEPAHYAILLLPGVFFALLVLVGKVSNPGIRGKAMAWVILVGFILSFSLVGYLGLILCLASIFSNNLKGKLFPKISIVLFLAGALYFITQTNLMYKITTLPSMFTNIKSYQYNSSDLTGFALASNLMVAKEGLTQSKYLGTGLNTHKDTYDKVIYRIFNNSQVIMELNKDDAGSLFIRLISEFGIPGILAFFLFLYRNKTGKKYESSPLKYINSLCLVILISYAVRNGNYLSIYLWLFLALYYYSYTQLKEANNIPSLLITNE